MNLEGGWKVSQWVERGILWNLTWREIRELEKEMRGRIMRKLRSNERVEEREREKEWGRRAEESEKMKVDSRE